MVRMARIAMITPRATVQYGALHFVKSLARGRF